MLVSVALTLSHLRVSPCVCRINVSVFGAWRDACASIRFLCVLQSALKQWKANDCDVKTTPTCTSWSFSSFPCDHKPFSLLWCCAQQPPMAHLSHLIFIYKCQPVMCWWSQTVKYWTMLYSSNNLRRSIVWFSSLIFLIRYQRGSKSLDMWRKWVQKRSLDFFPAWLNAVIHDNTSITLA